jgi:hypothetical protein
MHIVNQFPHLVMKKVLQGCHVDQIVTNPEMFEEKSPDTGYPD